MSINYWEGMSYYYCDRSVAAIKDDSSVYYSFFCGIDVGIGAWRWVYYPGAGELGRGMIFIDVCEPDVEIFYWLVAYYYYCDS